MLDSYYWGNVSRISPEAPVPIVAVNKKENRLGGAGNVVINIQAMGANPII
ncbi:MAG TPA: D-glycero-beta-D-manno-heptose-7-phosphate kinase, partial [Bacteroidia bacterium]|nr:D-glycero-beta-D-manno-heptose-7-phosphate kinase [Bacteroidia bacterium]